MSDQKKTKFQIDPVPIESTYAERTWKILEHAIQEIYNDNASTISFEEVHRNVYNMVQHKFGEKIYSGLVLTMTSCLKETEKSIEAAQGDLFLEELNRKWADHSKALNIIQHILIYMDNTFVPRTHKTPVHKLGLNLWRDNIIHSSKIQLRLQNALLGLVLRDRTNEVINRGLMRNLIKMLMDLGSSVYEEDFEKSFLKDSTDFYCVKSQHLIQCCDDCGDYLKKVERCLNEEIERVFHYLDAQTESKICNVVEKEMIETHMHRLVHMENSGLVKMIIDDKYEDLGRMYSLFNRVPNGLSVVKDLLIYHIRDKGKRIVTDPDELRDPVDFVQRLLDEKDKHNKIITLAFNNDKAFLNALNSSFEYFINLNSRLPEFISLYVDDRFRKGPKVIKEEDVEIVLDKVVVLFRYVQEKDVFEKYYRQHLAKRLLSQRATVSDNAETERSLIRKLKTECGHQFTSKLEGMFTDMRISQDTVLGFYESIGAKYFDYPTFTVQILSAGYWPFQSDPSCNLPSEILGIRHMFQKYYLEKHSGRRVNWVTNIGTADLKATFGKGQKHRLNVSTYQMCILALFNNADRLTYKEIEKGTEIPALNLKRSLQSLACVQGKNVLRKEPISKEVAEDDEFFFNEGFTSKHYKVKIGTVAAEKESESEKQKTRESVEAERRPQIDAAIVRIMKSRKVLDHSNMVGEVTRQLQLRFLPNPVLIKQQIESLIEREFLERDETDWNLYRYLA